MFNFKRNTKLYLVETSNPLGVYRYRLPIYTDLYVSQTFNEQSYKSKTLHRPGHLHEAAVITAANPGNFSFTFPLLDMGSKPICLIYGSELDSNYQPRSFDIFIESDNQIFRLEKCVIDSMVFNLERTAILTVSIAGTYKRQHQNPGAIPGTLIDETVGEYTILRRSGVLMDGTYVDSIVSLNLEISNSVTWTSYKLINDVVKGNISYPSSYSLSERRISGNITQYLTGTNESLFENYDTSSSLIVSLFSKMDQVTPLLEFNFPSVVYTRGNNLGEVYTRAYDFRLNTNTTLVKPIYKGV